MPRSADIMHSASLRACESIQILTHTRTNARAHAGRKDLERVEPRRGFIGKDDARISEQLAPCPLPQADVRAHTLA